MSNARNLADLIASGGVIEASEIADSTITGGKLASDITISTTGSITSGGLTVDTSTLYVNSSNNKVGIGTTSPTQPLTVYNTAAAQIHISTANPAIRFSSDSSGSSDTTRGFIGYATNTDAFMIGSSSGDLVIRGNSTDSVLIGTPTVKTVEVTGSGVDVKGDLTVDTSTLYVDSSNNRVGIGTTSPSFELDVVGDMRVTSAGSNNGIIQIDSNSSNRSLWRIRAAETGPSGQIQFLNFGNGSTFAVKSVITHDGKMGVNNTAPSYNLEVTGDAYVSTDLTIGGNLTVSGTTTTIDTTNTQVTDNLLELNSGATANTNDAGIIIERGTTGDNAIMAWDESADQFIFGTTTATASDTGNLTITAGDINVGGITTTGVTSSGNIVLGDDDEIRMGASTDLWLRHESASGNSYIYHGTTSPFYVRTEKFRLTNKLISEAMIQADANGEVRLYYDNSEKLNTFSSGVNVSGIMRVNEYDGGHHFGAAATGTSQDATLGLAATNINGGISPKVVMTSKYDSQGGLNGSALTLSTRNGSGVNEWFRIDANGRIGIATSNMSSFNSQADNLVVGDGSGDTGITIYSGSTSGDTGNIFFADGTSDPDYVRGGITYDHGTDQLKFRVNDGNRMEIDSSGNVGIGTSSPVSPLHVISGAVFQGSTQPTYSGSNLGALNINNNTADGTLDFSQGIVFTDNVNNGSAWTHAGIVSVGSSGYNGSLVFGTDGSGTQSSGNTSGITERMRITYDGDVGIGTTSPDGILHTTGSGDQIVTHEAGGEARLILKTTGTTDSTTLRFSDADAIAGSIVYTHGTNEMKFYTNGLTNVDMLIDSSGRVGIGDTSPDALLSIKGDSDAGTTPSIRLKDGTDTREAFISNQSGDLILATASSSDNVIDSAITIYSSQIVFNTSGTTRLILDSSGHWLPDSTNTYDLGSSTKVWRNIYTSDFHMSNEGLDKGNDIDGTKGSWTFQEGENDLFLINNKNGKKYKFNLTEVA